MAYPDRPHLAFPLELSDDGRLVVHEQDTLEDVRSCVRVLLRTPLGARPLAPDVGVPDPTFTRGINPPVLKRTLEHPDNGEPRADVTVRALDPLPSGQQQVSIGVDLADEPRGIDPDAIDQL